MQDYSYSPDFYQLLAASLSYSPDYYQLLGASLSTNPLFVTTLFDPEGVYHGEKILFIFFNST